MAGIHKEPGLYDDIYVDGFTLAPKNRYLKALTSTTLGYTKEIIKKLNQRNFKPDIIHCHEPASLMQATKLKKHIDCKLIYDVHEFFLGYSFDRYKDPLRSVFHLGKELRQIKMLFKYVDATISVNDIIRSYNVVLNPYIKHILVSNGYIFDETDQASSNMSAKIVLVHEGSLSFNRGLKFMIECFDDEYFRKNVILKIVGELRNQEKLYFEEQAKIKPWLLDSIVQTGWLDYMEVPKHLSGSMGLILMEPAVNNLLAGPPNKLFNYISASLPVISFDVPASTRMIEMYNVGLVVERNLKSFKAGIQKVILDYDLYKANIAENRKYFSFESEAGKLYALYDELLQ